MISAHEPWLIKYIPESGRTAIDIGSAEGVWTDTLAHRFRRVIAFDPVQQIPVLGVENVEFYNKAVWSSDTTLTFTSYGDYGQSTAMSNMGTHLPEAYGSAREIQKTTAEAITLDSLNLHEVDFIKIDCEGAEWDVIQGAFQTIMINKPSMIIEIHIADNEKKIRKVLPMYEIEKIPHPSPDAHNYWLYLTADRI